MGNLFSTSLLINPFLHRRCWWGCRFVDDESYRIDGQHASLSYHSTKRHCPRACSVRIFFFVVNELAIIDSVSPGCLGAFFLSMFLGLSEFSVCKSLLCTNLECNACPTIRPAKFISYITCVGMPTKVFSTQ